MGGEHLRTGQSKRSKQRKHGGILERLCIIEAKGRENIKTQCQIAVKIEEKKMSIEKTPLNLAIKRSLGPFARSFSEEWLELEA